jgi:hypothetical protein
MRTGMVVYITGLVLVTSAIELTLALVLASRGAVPAPSSGFFLVYLLVDIGLFSAGSLVVTKGLQTLRSERSVSEGVADRTSE